MSNFVYTWKPGTEQWFDKKDAGKVAEEILSIGENPTNQQIVDKARDENTELHDMFEWDNDVAADKYREHQAHRIVCCLSIVPVGLNNDKPEEPQTPIRLLHHVNKTQGYTPIYKIMNDEVMHKQLLDQAYADLRAFKVKYQMLDELQEIFKLIP